MNTLRIGILNPKATKLLQDLAELKLITIEKDSDESFKKALQKLRKNASSAPTLEEITKEVEIVRTKRYGK